MDIRDPEVRSKMLNALVNFPANGKPPQGFDTEAGVITLWLKEHGLIAEHETKRPCRECGTPRVDHTYMKITPAGRLFMLASGAEW